MMPNVVTAAVRTGVMHVAETGAAVVAVKAAAATDVVPAKVVVLHAVQRRAPGATHRARALPVQQATKEPNRALSRTARAKPFRLAVRPGPRPVPRAPRCWARRPAVNPVA